MIDADLLQNYLDRLGQIGASAGGGTERLVYGNDWVRAQEQIATWMAGAGLEVRRDAVGNVFGRWPGSEGAGTVLSGSHVDTVRSGGRFDGALGILSALIAIRALKDAFGPPARSLEVVSLAEEEGSRFHGQFWGTRGILGQITPDEIDALTDDRGVTIGEAMRDAGLDPAEVGSAARNDVEAFVELHIEQGAVLEQAGQNVGVVDWITGITQQRIELRGRTDHAGTTPMDLRQDAALAAAWIALGITRQVEEAGSPAVVTFGRWDIQPGAWNIVPGKASLALDLRHPDDATRRRLMDRARALCQAIVEERQLDWDVELVHEMDAQAMSPDMQATLQHAADARGLRWRTMASGAGHDSLLMAQRVPTGMLFVPSVGGRSHSPAEYTTPEAAADGAELLAEALHELAY